MKVCIFDIKRFAIHDGPGIRTTVFFKGCRLNCRWCHNPEGISSDIEHFDEEKEFDDVNLVKEIILGRWITLDELLVEIEKDRIFMEESGGGVTFSGGEPLMQHVALFAILKDCRVRKIHTALDTSGLVSESIFQQATELADLILYDLKSLDDEIHTKYTGMSNRKILENLEIALKGAARVVLRIPLVSGFNDTHEDQKQLIAYLEGLDNLHNLVQIDILPYHLFGMQKYKRFQKHNRQNGFGTPSGETVNSLKEGLIKAGFAVNVGG